MREVLPAVLVAGICWTAAVGLAQFDPTQVDGLEPPTIEQRLDAIEKRLDALEALQAPAETQPVVVVHSYTGCRPCARWWATERVKLEALGWRVLKQTEQPTAGNRYPWFEVYQTDGTRSVLTGYQQTANFQKIITEE